MAVVDLTLASPGSPAHRRHACRAWAGGAWPRPPSTTSPARPAAAGPPSTGCSRAARTACIEATVARRGRPVPRDRGGRARAVQTDLEDLLVTGIPPRPATSRSTTRSSSSSPTSPRSSCPSSRSRAWTASTRSSASSSPRTSRPYVGRRRGAPRPPSGWPAHGLLHVVPVGRVRRVRRGFRPSPGAHVTSCPGSSHLRLSRLSTTQGLNHHGNDRGSHRPHRRQRSRGHPRHHQHRRRRGHPRGQGQRRRHLHLGLRAQPAQARTPLREGEDVDVERRDRPAVGDPGRPAGRRARQRRAVRRARRGLRRHRHAVREVGRQGVDRGRRPVAELDAEPVPPRRAGRARSAPRRSSSRCRGSTPSTTPPPR